MKIVKYPDGSSYAELDKTFPLYFTYRLNSYEDVIHLIQIIEAFNHSGSTPTVMIPNLIDAQADRRFAKNQSSGLKIICKLLNSVDANYEVFHPHNPEVVEALLNNVTILDNTYFIKEVLSTIYCETFGVERDKGLFYHIKQELWDNLILMSSDAGGFKPLMKLCDNLKWRGEVASASKSREYKNGETILTQLISNSDFKGKDILIIDDICVYGGTFKGLSKLLKERNCGKLYLAVSHMTVQDLGTDPVLDYFEKVFTTNSKYEEYNICGNTSLMSMPGRHLEMVKVL